MALPFSFHYPLVLLAIIPTLLFIIFYYHYNLHKLDAPKEQKLKKKKLSIFLTTTRIIILTLLIIAVAQPYLDRTTTKKGDPHVKILVDNTTSMQLYERDFIPKLQHELEKHLPTDLLTIADGETTPLADGILANTKQNENLLLISDGQNNIGIDLGDVALYAAQRNITINALKLKEKNYDNAITILGPEKTIANVENAYALKIRRTKPGPVRVTLEIDGTITQDTTTTADTLQFTQAFDSGYHTLKASIISYDHFPQNNIYYNVIKIVPKPNLLMLTERPSTYEELLAPLYDLTLVTSIPTNLNDYGALIINDLPTEKINPTIDTLVDYLAEGNGMVIVGGLQSYDAGGYKNSKFEQLLPVIIAQTGKQRGETSVVLLIDISGSTGQTYGDAKKVDVEKALAIEVLNDLGLTNKLGVVAFNTETYTLSNMSYIIEKDLTLLEDQIARLRDSGGTLIHVGFLKANEMLQNTKGSKNIILISDGLSQEPGEMITTAKYLASQGVKIYTVGVGEDTNAEAMQQIADLTGGTYFQPTLVEKIKLVFGDTERLGDRKVHPLVVFDEHHFITDGVKLTANLYGYNIVAPKTNAKLLATTDTGDPIVIASRFGLGRVVALATDDGTLYAPELLNKQNSKLLTRIMNWALGDPERKNERYIDVHDGRVGLPTEAIIKSPTEPNIPDISFVKTDANLYRAEFVPQHAGIYTLLDARYAVNNKKEYENIGFNPELGKIVAATGGKLFEPEQIQDIVDHAKERSTRHVIERANLAWIFALIALLIYLSEVSVRRIIRNFYT